MKNLIYAINLTLDGCLDHTSGIADDELLNYYTNLIQNVDTFVYGRKTYELMVPYWPDIAKAQSATKAENEFANAFSAINKIVVFSKTLDKAEGENTEIIRTDLKDAILKLKQEEGGDILAGGVDIPSQLIKLNLVDEYLFVVQPIFAGGGRRLFDDAKLPELLKLKLVESKTLKSGCIALRYLKS